MHRRWGWKVKIRSHGEMHRHANAIVGSLIMLFQFAYLYCTKTAFEPLSCIDKEDGKSYMRFEPKIRCGEGDHLWLAPMGIVFGCLYGVGIPLMFTIILYRNRKMVKGDQILRVLGIGRFRGEGTDDYYAFRKRYYKLYYRFKPKYNYWGQIILLRKFLIALCAVFLKANPTLQATLVSLICFLSYSIQINIKPYLRNDLLGVGDDNDDIDLDAIKSMARRQRTMSTEERRNRFSFVNTASRSNLRRASHRAPSTPGIELVDRVSQRSVAASNESKHALGRRKVEAQTIDQDDASRSNLVARLRAFYGARGVTKNDAELSAVAAVAKQRDMNEEKIMAQIELKYGGVGGTLTTLQQQSRSKSRPIAKMTRERRLNRLLQTDTDHAAFDQNTSEGVWSSLGIHDGDDGFSRDRGLSREHDVSEHVAVSSTFAISKKFVMST